MVKIVKVDMRRGEGTHVFSLLRFITRADGLEYMQLEYPFPLLVIRTFPDFYEDDFSYLFSHFEILKVDGSDRDLWFYAYPSLLSFVERCTEDDIKNHRVVPLLEEKGGGEVDVAIFEE